MSDERGDVSFVIGLAVGAVVGAVGAALLLPRGEVDLREQAAERGIELRGRAEDLVTRAQRVASEAVSRVQGSAQRVIGTSQNGDVGGGGI